MWYLSTWSVLVYYSIITKKKKIFITLPHISSLERLNFFLEQLVWGGYSLFVYSKKLVFITKTKPHYTKHQSIANFEPIFYWFFPHQMFEHLRPPRGTKPISQNLSRKSTKFATSSRQEYSFRHHMFINSWVGASCTIWQSLGCITWNHSCTSVFT